MVEADPAVVAEAGRILSQHSRFVREHAEAQQHSRGATVAPPAPAAPSEPSIESVTEAAPEATPETPPKEPDAAPEEPTVDTVAMPRAQLDELLAKVRSVDQSKQGIEAARKELALDLMVSEWAKTATPEQRAALQSVLEGRHAQAPARAEADDDDDDQDEPRAALPPDYDQMRKVTAFLVSKEEARLKAAAEAERESTIDKAMEAYSAFKKDKGLAALARAKIVADLAADPQLDPIAVVAANAAEYGAWYEQARKSEAGSTSAVARSASGSPARGGNAGAFTAKDMKDGKVMDAVIDAFRRGDLRR